MNYSMMQALKTTIMQGLKLAICATVLIACLFAAAPAARVEAADKDEVKTERDRDENQDMEPYRLEIRDFALWDTSCVISLDKDEEPVTVKGKEASDIVVDVDMQKRVINLKAKARHREWYDWRTWKSKKDKLYINISVPINELEIVDSAMLISADLRDSGIKSFKLLGSDVVGSFKFLFPNMEKLYCDIDGVFNVKFKGKTDKLIFKAEGVANVDLKRLKAKKCKLEASGTGKYKVYASEILKVESEGPNIIKYAGDPERIEKDVEAYISRLSPID